jgi:hypothetical protein
MTISVNCIWSTEIVNGALFVCVGGFGNVVEVRVSGVVASVFPFGWPQPLSTSAISTVPQHNLEILTSELTGRDGFVMINPSLAALRGSPRRLSSTGRPWLSNIRDYRAVAERYQLNCALRLNMMILMRFGWWFQGGRMEQWLLPVIVHRERLYPALLDSTVAIKELLCGSRRGLVQFLGALH